MKNQTNQKQIAAIYVRVSSTHQKDEKTIDSQLDTLIKYKNENNIEVPKEWIFKDEGFSGTILDRPGLDELRDIVRESAINMILVYSPDRLARKYVNQLILEEEFFKHNVKLVYMLGSKSESPEDQMLKHFQGIFAEYEREQILDRSRRGKLYKARKGEIDILPKAPYGYEKNRDKFFAIYPEQATVVKEIFYLYTKQNYSLNKIKKYLTDKEVTSPSGKIGWATTTVRDILRNTAYIGTAYYGKTERYEGQLDRIARYKTIGKLKKPKKPKRPSPKDSWFPISVPAIISEVDFQIAHDLLQRNKNFAKRNTKQPSILQGLLVCGCCGSSYYKRIYTKGDKKYSSYFCSSRKKGIKFCGNANIKQNVLDELIWSNILNLLKNPILIEEEIKRRIEEHPKKLEKIQATNVRLALDEVKNAQNRLLDAYQLGGCLELNELKVRMKELKKSESEFIKELKSIEAESLIMDKCMAIQMTVEHFQDIIAKNAPILSLSEKQKILRSLIDEIVIEQGAITIKHVIPLSFDESCSLSSATQV